MEKANLVIFEPSDSSDSGSVSGDRLRVRGREIGISRMSCEARPHAPCTKRHMLFQTLQIVSYSALVPDHLQPLVPRGSKRHLFADDGDPSSGRIQILQMVYNES